MRALDRKLVRDLWRLRAPLAAVALVVAAGVGALVMAWSTSASLQRSRATYYDEQRFPQVFAGLKRAPESVARDLGFIPGVSVVQTRLVHEVNLSVPGLPEPGAARLVSIPDDGPPALNAVHLRRGRLPELHAPDEAVASEPFAEANGLGPGDTVGAVINGRWRTLRIVGIGLSPEFVYFVRGGEMLPDARRSGVLWMRRGALAAAIDMDGAFNDASFTLDPAAAPEEVIRRIDELLDRHGGLGAHTRSDHVSDRYLTDEFDQLAVMGTLTPAIFLAVGAFLVNVVLGRLVKTQREQIATLKAFGYSRLELARHVALLALCVCLVGAAVGVGVGWAMGRELTSLYVEIYRFPRLEFLVDVRAVIIGGSIAIIASGAGVLSSLRWVARLSPAEAMRPEVPHDFRATILERLGVSALATRWRMAIRSVESHPWRTVMGMLGIAMSSAVIVLSNFALDAVEHMIDSEYNASQRGDAAVTFNEPVSASVLPSVATMGGRGAVLRAEGVRIAPVRLWHEHVSRRLAIVGIQPGAELTRPIDERGLAVEIPPEGVLLSSNLADILGAKPGETVSAEFLHGRRARADLVVAGVFSGYVGLTAYMNLGALCGAAEEGRVLSGLAIKDDGASALAIADELKRTPVVASVTYTSGMIESFREMIGQNITKITIAHALFASVIAFGVVYNTARIAFAERQRELATLRVLGFRRTEVERMLLGEIWLLVAVGTPLGLALGRALAWVLVRAMETESYVVPLVILPRTYALAAVVTLVASAASALVVHRGVARLDLLATLKEA